MDMAMQTASLLLAIQNDLYFPLKFRAELVEPAFDADRSDWQIAKRGVVNPLDSAVPGCDVSDLECPFQLHPFDHRRGQPQPKDRDSLVARVGTVGLAADQAGRCRLTWQNTAEADAGMVLLSSAPFSN